VPAIRVGPPSGPGKDPWLARKDWVVRRVRDDAGPLALVVGRFAFAEDTTAFWTCVSVGTGLTLFALALTLFGVLTHPNRIEIRRDVVVVRRGLFGRGWDRRIPRREVTAVTHVPVQNGPRLDHSIEIETKDGKSYNAALSLRDLAEARWLAGEIGRRVHGG
jgi:PH (Pleckstrin Homology) domain-containing protein